MNRRYQYAYNKSLISFAKSNRKANNEAEARLWYFLRNRQLSGYKFRRQFAISNYILDFYCVENKLAVELDGSQHIKNKRYDRQRDNNLKQIGIRVIRFWDNDIFNNIDSILDKILITLKETSINT